MGKKTNKPVSNMANKQNNKPAEKPANTKQTIKPASKKPENKAPEKPATKPVEQPTEVVEAQVVETNPTGGNIIESMMNNAPQTVRHLSPDGASMLAYVMQRKYFDDPSAKDRYSATFLNSMSAVQDGIIVGTVIQEVVMTNSPLALVIRKGSYKQLRQIAMDYGVKLPEQNELALPTPQEVEAMKKFGITETDDGQLRIPFTPEDVDANTKKKIQHEAKAAEANVEMDPTKITSDEDAAKALTKIYANRNIKGSIHQVLLNAIKFVKDYRYAQADRENKNDVKTVLKTRTVEDWLTDAISIKEPLLILKNVASTLCNSINKVSNPITAFLSFKSAISTNNVCPLSDNEIAMIIKSLVKWYVQYMTAEYQSQLDTSKKMTEKAKEAVLDQIEYLKNVKEHLTEFDTNKIQEMPDARSTAANADIKTLYFFTRSLYYQKDISGKKSPEEYFTNLAYNVWNRVIEIANLFLREENQIENMGEQNILELEVAENAESTETETDKGDTETSENNNKESGDRSSEENSGENEKN